MDDPDASLMVPLSLSFTVIMFVGNEIYYQYWKRREDPFIIEDFYPVITADEFEDRVKKGEKLVILDNLVLDIAEFIKMHPGGAFLLEGTYGRDISKFFYGGYALDGNSNDPSAPNCRHSHTNVARRIANRLVIALIDNRDVQINNCYINEEESVTLNELANCFAFKRLEVQVNDEAIEGGQKIHLLGKDMHMSNYYKDLNILGKHYTIVHSGHKGVSPSKYDGVVLRRHYTITNCLRRDFYEEMICDVRAHMSDTTINSIIPGTLRGMTMQISTILFLGS